MLNLKSHLPLILWLWMKTTFYQMIKNWTNTDREEDRIVDSFVGWKIKALYENGCLVKSIITTSYMKNTMSYMRMTPKTTSRLTILMVLRFSYFKVRIFHRSKVSWFCNILAISQKFRATKYLTSQHLQNSITAKTFNF